MFKASYFSFQLFVKFAHLLLLFVVSLQNGFNWLILVDQRLSIHLHLLDLLLLLKDSSFLFVVIKFKLVLEIFHLSFTLLLNVLLLSHRFSLLFFNLQLNQFHSFLTLFDFGKQLLLALLACNYFLLIILQLVFNSFELLCVNCDYPFQAAILLLQLFFGGSCCTIIYLKLLIVVLKLLIF